MTPLELTDLQTKCLGCALTESANTAAQHLLDRVGASTVDGILAAIFVAKGVERSLLLAIARQAIAEHRTQCVEPAHECL